jgi:hypothetical protein
VKSQLQCQPQLAADCSTRHLLQRPVYCDLRLDVPLLSLHASSTNDITSTKATPDSQATLGPKTTLSSICCSLFDFNYLVLLRIVDPNDSTFDLGYTKETFKIAYSVFRYRHALGHDVSSLQFPHPMKHWADDVHSSSVTAVDPAPGTRGLARGTRGHPTPSPRKFPTQTHSAPQAGFGVGLRRPSGTVRRPSAA